MVARPFKLVNSDGETDHGLKSASEVINLSDHNLSEHDYSLLNKGLQFIPTPKSIPQSQILRAATEFGKRIKIIKYFGSKKQRAKIPFTAKSDWSPPDSAIPDEIHQNLISMENEIKDIPVKTHKPNFTEKEMQALQNLKNNKNLVIKKADKGSATVIMNKNDYIFEANRQLSNTAHYLELSESRQSQTSEKIKEILLKRLQELKVKHGFIGFKMYSSLISDVLNIFINFCLT